MKRVQFKIAKDGNFTMDMLEGFSGMSCAEKTQEIEMILNATEVDRKEKPEYYDSEDTFNDIFGGGNF